MSGVGRLDLIHQFSYVENKKRAKAKTSNKHLSGVSDHVWSEVAFLANLTTTRDRTMLLGVRALISARVHGTVSSLVGCMTLELVATHTS